ncbi:unnamed protein product, partial [Amoebophrya sp. A25]
GPSVLNKTCADHEQDKCSAGTGSTTEDFQNRNTTQENAGTYKKTDEPITSSTTNHARVSTSQDAKMRNITTSSAASVKKKTPPCCSSTAMLNTGNETRNINIISAGERKAITSRETKKQNASTDESASCGKGPVLEDNDDSAGLPGPPVQAFESLTKEHLRCFDLPAEQPESYRPPVDDLPDHFF